MPHLFDVLVSLLASGARLGAGVFTGGHARKPERLLELYEFEGCPYCRKVREALTALDLDAKIYPCPKNGKRYRPLVQESGGKRQFPYLVDPNTDRRMYESDAIITYLFDTYGGRKPDLILRLGPLTNLTSFLASALRPSSGMQVRASRIPEKHLELYSFEGSPYCRLVRETLCELELPYILHNVGKGVRSDLLSPAAREKRMPNKPMSTENRREFVKRSGRMMVPYLVDPNTGTEMFESKDIREYLIKTYAL